MAETAINASPGARRLARQLGVQLDALTGTGPGGRVVKQDVEAAASQSAPAGQMTAAAVASERGEITIERLSTVQSTIAARMTQSRATVPDFTLTIEVDMDAALDLRTRLAALEPDCVPSINDLLVRGCALALRSHPRVNASYVDGAVELYGRVNIAIAVAAQDALLVPVVFDADTKSLVQLASETAKLAQRARSGALTPPEVSGATFTISSLGRFAIARFDAIVHAPQAAILAVGSIQEQAAVRDGSGVPCRRLSLTLTCDHRVLYGADAAAFLETVRATLEQPLRLLV